MTNGYVPALRVRSYALLLGVCSLLVGCGGIGMERAVRLTSALETCAQAEMANTIFVKRAMATPTEDRALRDELSDALHLLDDAFEVRLGLLDAMGTGSPRKLDRVLRENEAMLASIRTRTSHFISLAVPTVPPDTRFSNLQGVPDRIQE